MTVHEPPEEEESSQSELKGEKSKKNRSFKAGEAVILDDNTYSGEAIAMVEQVEP